MRLYREFSEWDKDGNRTAVDPTAVSAQTQTVAGVAIESLTPTQEAVGRYRIQTTDALYSNLSDYRVAWAATIGGSAFTRTVYYRHVTASGADVTGPGAAGIGLPAVTDTGATFPHVEPPDADYDHTVIYCVSQPGGVVVTGTGSGTTIAVPGLTPGTHWIATAIAYDASGNPSVVGAASVVAFDTLSAAVPTMAFYVKWFVNDEDGYHEFGPEVLDAAAVTPYAGGSLDYRIGGGGFVGLGRGRNIQILIEAHDAVAPEVTSVGVLENTPFAPEPGGHRGEYGT